MIQFSVSLSAAVAIENYKQELINALDSNLLDKQFIESIQTIDKKYLEKIASGIKLKKELTVDKDNQCLIIAKSLQNKIKSDNYRMKRLDLVND
jgi:predicted RNA-binding protein Jag